MDILSFRQARKLTQAEFAAFLTTAGSQATQGLVSQWERGDVVITAERAVEIERATGGQITRSELRPDLWPMDGQAA
jgi:DNA-binding transcriptional regulator YdaS (Cro superfamily)